METNDAQTPRPAREPPVSSRGVVAVLIGLLAVSCLACVGFGAGYAWYLDLHSRR